MTGKISFLVIALVSICETLCDLRGEILKLNHKAHQGKHKVYPKNSAKLNDMEIGIINLSHN